MSAKAAGQPVLPLSALLGQEAAAAALAALAARRGEPIPPLLLHGPEGVGKRTAALSLAAALVCEQPSGADACGACRGCRRVADAEQATTLRDDARPTDAPQVYPDVGLVSLPDKKTRISILQARDIVHSLASRPFELPYRVYIIDPADRMNAAAANALLKALEEPPAHSVLILVTASPWSLPITVRSRLRGLRFRPLAAAAIERLLVARGASPDQAASRAAVARGSMVRATEEDPQQEADRIEAWVALLEALALGRRRPAELAAAASEDFAGNADEAGAQLDLLLAVLRDLAAAPSGAAPLVLSHAQLERLAPHGGRLLGEVGGRPELVDRLRRELVVFNRNARLVVEGAVLAIAGALQPRHLSA